MAASSSGPAYRNNIRCLSISAKYSFASLAVLVPKPTPVKKKKSYLNNHPSDLKSAEYNLEVKHNLLQVNKYINFF